MDTANKIHGQAIKLEKREIQLVISKLFYLEFGICI